MSVSYLAIEKINELNRRYSKREIKSNLLHVLKIKENNPDLMLFQKEVFHEGQYNKNLEYLNRINNSHLDFFNNTIIANSDKNLNLFKCTERLISSIGLEKKKIENFSLNSNLEGNYNNLEIASLLYSKDSQRGFDHSGDFISGNFLFNRRLINSLLDDNTFSQNFQFFDNFLNSLDENFTLIEKERILDLNKKSNRIKNIFNPNRSENNNNSFPNKLNEYFKNYLSFPYILDSNGKISNFKKHPLSLSMLGQSIVNLIENDDYISTNSLYYGLYPVNTIQNERLKIEEVTNFSMINSKEILPLKYIENSNNFKFSNENIEFKEFKEKTINFLMDSKNYFLSTKEKNNIQEGINFYQNNFENTRFYNTLNCDNSTDFSSFSKVFLLNKSQISPRYPLLKLTEKTNKLNIFKRAINTSFTGAEVENKPLINEDDFASTLQLENFKLHSLNLIELISSFINTDTMHVLEAYEDSSLKVNVQYNNPENISTNQIGLNINSMPGIGGARQTSTFSGTNSNQNNSNFINLNMYRDNISYRKKKNILNGKTGINNVSFFNEENDFNNSIIRIKKEADFVIKEIKKYQNKKMSDVFIDKIDSVFKFDMSNLKNENLIDHIRLTSNDNEIKKNIELIEKFQVYPLDHIDNSFVFQGQNPKSNVLEDNLTSVEKLGQKNINDIFSDLDQESLGLNESIFEKETTLNQSFSEKIDKNNFGNFTSSSVLFDFITNFCRKFIHENLTDDDADNNFSQRANISETATLLGLYNNFTKGLSQDKKNEFKEIIHDSVSRIYLGLPDGAINRKDIFEGIKDNIEYLTSVNPFYLFGENLTDGMNYNEYDPYENNDNIYEQNGFFYHFLFSLYSQKKSYRFGSDSIIREYRNSANVNDSNKSPFYFSCNDKDNFNLHDKQRCSIKNIFNSGIFDYRSKELKKVNAFKPNLSLTMYNGNISFIVTHETTRQDKFEDIKSYIKSYFQNLKENESAIRNKIKEDYEYMYTQQIFPSSLYDIINDEDSIIQRKNILNIATPTRSFFQNPGSSLNRFNFFDKMANEIFNNTYVKGFIDNPVNRPKLKKILESIFLISSEVFLKMYAELQSYSSVCNRVFESSIFFKGFNSSLSSQFSTGKDQENIDKFVDNFENVRNFYNLFKSFNNEGYEKIYAKLKLEYSRNDNSANNDVNFSIAENTKSLLPNSNFKNKPSFIKLFYLLKNIFKLKNEDLEKVATYVFSNTEFHSKFHFLFDIFNLNSISSQNYFENFNKISSDTFFVFPLINSIKIATMTEFNLKIFNFLNDSNCIFFDYLYEDISRSDNKIARPVYDSFEGNIFKENGELNERLNFINSARLEDYFLFFVEYAKLFEIFSMFISDSKFDELKNINIKKHISLKDIFEQIISKSYEKSFNYNIEEKTSNDQKSSYVKSGCELILDIYPDFLSYSSLSQRNMLWLDNQINTNGIVNFQNYKNISRSNILSDTKSIDIQHNWFNHITRGLLVNDFSYVSNMEIVKYFNSYSGIGKDIQDTYSFINAYRKNTNANTFFNISAIDAKNTLKNETGFNNFKTKENNFDLKDSYIHQFFKSKITKNIKDKFLLENKNVDAVIPVLKNELFKNYLKDFYIDYHINSGSLTERITNITTNKYCNSANSLENSTILTVGIEKEIEIKRNDIIILTVEMIDHDYPDLIWEKKTFEFDTSINNPVDDIFSFRSQNDRANLVDSNLSFISDSINIPLTDYFPSSDFDKKLLNEIVASTTVSIPNTTNNILNPFLTLTDFVSSNLTSNFDDLIQRRQLELNESYISRLKLLGLEENSSNQSIVKELIQRSIFNQLYSYKLEKILKFLTGFEGKTNFSIMNQDEKFLQGCYILREVYDLFVSQIFNVTNIENLGFTNEELTNAFSIDGLGTFENDISYKGYNFKVASITTNHDLNIFIKFMHGFTCAIIPDFVNFAKSNFSRILNVAIKPEDFIITTLKYQNTEIPPINAYSGLNFRILTNERFPALKDELNTSYNIINNNVYSSQNIQIKNYEAYKGNNKYVPKNVSYRIKLDLLEN